MFASLKTSQVVRGNQMRDSRSPKPSKSSTSFSGSKSSWSSQESMEYEISDFSSSTVTPDLAFRIMMLSSPKHAFLKRELLHAITVGEVDNKLAIDEDLLMEKLSEINFRVTNTVVENFKVRVTLYDTSKTTLAAEPYSPRCYAGTDGVMIVFDIADTESLQGARSWLDVLAYTGYRKSIFLVGTRWERAHIYRKTILSEVAENAADECGATYFELSTFSDFRGHLANRYEMMIRHMSFDKLKDVSLLNFGGDPLDLSWLSSSVEQRILSMDREYNEAVFNNSGGSDPSEASSTSTNTTPTKRALSRKKTPASIAAVQSRDMDLLRKSVSLRNVNSVDPMSKATALHMACARSESVDLDIVRHLLNMQTVDVDKASRSGATPLIAAVRGNGSECGQIIMLLLAKGANTATCDRSGNTPLHIACETGNKAAVLSLIDHYHVDLTNEFRETPLHLACRARHPAVVALLLQKGAMCCSVEDNNAATALHLAVRSKDEESIKLVIQSAKHTTVNAITKDGKSALYMAAELDLNAIVTMLLSNGADPRAGKSNSKLSQNARFMAKTFLPLHFEWIVGTKHKKVNLSQCHLHMIPADALQMTWITELNLSRNKIEAVPRSISQLAQLEQLDMSSNALRTLPSDLLRLTALQKLKLRGNAHLPREASRAFMNRIRYFRGEHGATTLDLSDLGLHKLSEIISGSTFLTQLGLNKNHLNGALPKTLSSLTGLTSLWLQENKIDYIPDYFEDFKEMELLNLAHNKLITVGLLGNAPVLRELWLEHNSLSEFPESLGDSRSLERIWLDFNQMSSIPASIGRFVHLKRLSLIGNQISDISPEIGRLTLLEKLWLDNNSLESIPETISSLKNLATLSINGNPFGQFPSGICALEKLVELSLNETWLEYVDPAIGNLCHLAKLELRGNKFTYLPQTVGHLTALKKLDLRQNPSLTSPPPEQVRAGAAAVVGFMQDLMGDSRPSYRMKLMIVGQENVGKTCLIRCLLKKANVARVVKRPPVSTDGIDIHSMVHKQKLNSGETVKMAFNLWDFAGQEVYYSTHSFFLSIRSLFVVLWRLTDAAENQRVSYWLQSIASRAPQAAVLLVGTYADAVNQENLEAFGEQTVDKYRAMFPKLQILGFMPFSAQTGLNRAEIKARIIQESLKQPFMGEPIPLTYLELEKAVIVERGRRNPPVMSWKEFYKLGQSCALLEESVLRATSLLHELGAVIYFNDKKSGLSDLVVLDPQWLTQVMAQVVSTKTSFVRNGMLNHKHIPQIWRAPSFPPSLHSQLIQLLEAFEISMRLTTDEKDSGEIYAGASLIPVLLQPRHSSPDRSSPLWESYEHCAPIYRRYVFDFLPRGFFNRLMIRLFHFATREHYWADSMVASHQGVSVVTLNVHESTVDVEVRAQDNAQKEKLFFVQLITENIDNMLNWFNVDVETLVPCVHCRGENSFTLKECEMAAAQGVGYLRCGDTPVALTALCPDLIVTGTMIDWGELQDLEEIGQGTFACVYRATYRGEVVAVKRLIDEREYGELRREAIKLQSLVHPKITALLGVSMNPPALVQEMMVNGSLFDWIHEPGTVLTWERRIAISTDIAEGMWFLHNTTPPLLHGDLKSANILLDTDLTAKIADFGTTTYVAPMTQGTTVNMPRWMAPEVLNQQPYGAPSDVYSYGIIMWELVTQRIPFDKQENGRYQWTHNVEDDILRGIRPAIPESCAEEFAMLMSNCWNHDAKERPTFQKVLRRLLKISIGDTRGLKVAMNHDLL